MQILNWHLETTIIDLTKFLDQFQLAIVRLNLLTKVRARLDRLLHILPFNSKPSKATPPQLEKEANT